MKYEFFTPYHRGPDLVFDFLIASQPFTRAPWSASADYGYERSQNTSIKVEDRHVGDIHSLSERYAALNPQYQDFMRALETAATEWKAAEIATRLAEQQRAREDDVAFMERILGK